VPDSKEGLSSIRSGKHDLILLDMAMPVFSGLDILRSLKAENTVERTNIVIFTASSDPKMYEEIRDSRVKEILKKPSGMEDLEQIFSRYRPNNSDLS